MIERDRERIVKRILPPAPPPVLAAAAALAGALANTGTMILTQNILHAPLFMDTMFTVVCTLLGGLPWGLSTAVLTHVIANPLVGTPWYGFLYIPCNMAVALLTALFMRLFPAECAGARISGLNARKGGKQPWASGFLERIVILFILSLAMCLLISLLGGLTSTIIEVFFTPWDSHSAELFIFRRMLVRKNLPLPLVEILSRVPVNLMDRLISVYGAYGIAAGIFAALRALRRTNHFHD